MEKKITKDTTFAELLMQNRGAAEKLAEMGMFCGGCPMAQFETIEQGASAHGIDVDEILKELNSSKGTNDRKR